MRFSHLQICSSMLALAVAACGRAGPTQSPSSTGAGAGAGPACAVRGRVLGHDGQPMKMAHVHRGDRTIAAGARGEFCLPLDAEAAASRQFVPIRITGVGHAEQVMGLLLEGLPVEVEVQLGTHGQEPSLSQMVVIVLEPDGDGQELIPVAQHALAAQPDGTYAATVVPGGPDVWYQLSDLATGQTLAGTHANTYFYDGGSDYVSRESVHGDQAVVRFDPRTLPPAGRPPQVRFAQPSSRSARIAALHADMLVRQRAFAEQWRRWQARGRDATSKAGEPAARAQPEAQPKAQFDGSWRADLVAARAQEADPEVRAALALMYLTQPMTLDRSTEQARTIAAELLAELPADAPLWEVAPYAILTATELVGHPPEQGAYIEQMIASLADPEAAAGILFEQMILAARAQQSDRLGRYYRIMMARYRDTQAAQIALEQFDPTRAVSLGRAVPDFELPSFDRRRERLTAESFRGRVVLIDFWATWCKPCIEEMDNLHHTYEKYKDQGFTILSIATGDAPDAVRAVRRGQWRMPWHHVVLTEENQEEIKERFGIGHLPFAILIDGNGTIVALELALRGPALGETVAAVLAATRAAPASR